MQGVLQRLGVGKTCIIPLQLQSDGMVKRYTKTTEEHLRRAVAFHPPCVQCINLRHYMTGRRKRSVRERTPTALWPDIWVLPEKERPTIDNAANLVYGVHDVHNHESQNLNLTSERMKVRHDCQPAPRAFN
jgi:hypothetical protein